MSSPSRPQSHLRQPLTSLLGSAGNVRVIRVLATRDAPQSASQLAAEAGLTPQGTRLVLDALVQRRLVTAHGSGRAQTFAVNALHPLTPALRTLFEEEHQRWDSLLESIRRVLHKHASSVSAAWLYGSVARGDDTPRSDLDLALVVESRPDADQIRQHLMPVEDAQDIRISLTALTPQDLAALPEDDPWWQGVVRDARVLRGAAPEQVRRRLRKAA